MTTNQKGLVAVLLTAGILLVGWKIMSSGKKAQITWLIKNNYTSGTPASLSTFDNAFIKAWYKAAKAGQPTFLLEGKTYNTQGGKAI